MPDAIARIDRNLRFVYVNRMLENALRIPAAQLLGKTNAQVGLPEEYARVREQARSLNQTIWEAEQAAFDTTHAEVGAYLLGLWGLPNPVIEAVAFHHRPASGAAAKFSPVIAVHVANAFDHEQTGARSNGPGNRMDLAHLARLKLEGRLEAWRGRCLETEP